MTRLLYQPIGEWTFSDVRRWCSDRDYGGLFAAKLRKPMIALAERFDWSGNPIEPGFRRVRVLGRQLFVLSRAALGGNASAQACAPVVADVVLGHCIGPDGQFVARLGRDGRVIEPTADLYDIAFGLFGLAWWYRASGDQRVPPAALRAVTHLQHALRSPSGMGFVWRADGSNQHNQNPHMHLFEAALFLCAFLPHAQFVELAHQLFALAEQALFDRSSGTIAEEFDADWRATKNRNGEIRIEPGHQFEWAWLLDHYALLTGRATALGMSSRLYAFGQAVGIDPVTGLVFDAVSRAGQVLERDLRIWPNTERLKAQVVMAERQRDRQGEDNELLDTLARIRHYYLRSKNLPSGLRLANGWWIDYLYSDGYTVKSDHIPASSLYHIIFSFSEVLRFCDGHMPFSCHKWMNSDQFSHQSTGLTEFNRVANA